MRIRTDILLILVMGATLVLAGCGDDDGDVADSTTEPTATVSASSPTPAAEVELVSKNFDLPVTLTATGEWVFDRDDPHEVVVRHVPEDTGPGGFIHTFLPSGVYAHDGLTQQPVPDDLTAWVREHPRIILEGEQPATVGGLGGVQLEISSDQLDDWNLFETPSGPFEIYWNDRLRLFILDGPTGPIVVAAGAQLPEQFEQFLPLMEPAIETMEFSP